MAFEHYIRCGAKQLRQGYTTGTCAALAAKAAVQWMFSGVCPDMVSCNTGLDIPVEQPVEDPHCEDGRYQAAIRKDGGDDPDATHGLLIYSSVEKIEVPEGKGDPERAYVEIYGGIGVGRVTRPGMNQPPGNAAINSGPRSMITENVQEVCAKFGYTGGIRVVVSVPGGMEAAKHTFNPMMGVVGGISILGTTGIVNPMSEKALIASIELEMKQARFSSDRIILVPGNYGETFREENGYIWEDIPCVHYSGYLGEALDIASDLKFREALIISHVGKLVKTAGGIMNTHQKTADCRMEIVTAYAACNGADRELCRALMKCVTVDACVDLLEPAGLWKPVCEDMLAAVQKYLSRRVQGVYEIGAVMFSNVYGHLGMTPGTEALIAKWNEGRKETEIGNSQK